MDGSSYTLEALHEGSETTLYRAYRDTPSKTVLLRVANSNRQEIAGRLAREYGLAERLGRDGVLKATALTTHAGRSALVLEDPGGVALPTLLGDPMEYAFFLKTAVGVASALRQVHGGGIVHLDMCPSNIFVADTGDVLLTGFGRAMLVRERARDVTGAFVPDQFQFMSPEQTGRTFRAPDQRSDLYSLGIVLYKMLTGTVPFDAADAVDWFHCHIARPPPPPETRRRDLPPQLSSIVSKLLAKSPEERYQTAAGLEHDLRRCMGDWDGSSRINAFELGEQDAVDTLVAPRKIYGRDEQLQTMAATFDRVVRCGRSEIFLLSGYSGVGKSSLADAFLKSVAASDAIVAVGKIDQYRAAVPYSTITQAFAGLVDQLLSKEDDELASWREAIQDALGLNGQLMISLIPQLELVIGAQPQIVDTSPWEHQSRFRRVFRRFINVFAHAGRPLLLFLDDLQWVDVATVGLLETLVSEDDVGYIMILGAYRENEVGEGHPLAVALRDLSDAGRLVEVMTVPPLGLPDLSEMVAEAMTVTSSQAARLSALVFEKTEGNPFFAVQFLSTLVDQGLLKFDYREAHWKWELEDIRSQSMTENVATMLASKLDRLPLATRQALGILASLGSEASLRVLSAARGPGDEDCHTVLSEALDAGVVTTKGDRYLFLHDRLQEAAYALVPDDERQAMHLHIGRSLLASYSDAELEENVFDVAGQFSRGQGLITSCQERENVARLNLLAANRAKMSTAYRPARSFATAGMDLLGPARWKHQYELTFALALIEAECSLLTGDLDQAELLAKAMRTNCRTKIHQAMLCCTESDLHVIRSDYSAAISVALDCLKLFGIDLSTDPGEDDVAAAFENFWRLLDGRSIASLVDLPRSTDPDVEAAMRVLQALFTPAGLVNSNLFYMVVSYMVELTLRHGTSSPSPIGLSWFGVAIGHVSGSHPEALEIGLLANAIVERDDLVAERAKARFCLEMLMAWMRPIATSVDLVREAYAVANATGDVITACFSAAHAIEDRLLRGDQLDSLLAEIDLALAFARSAKYRDVVDCIIVQERFVKSMQGKTRSFGSFDGEGFDTPAFEAQLTGERMAVMMFFYWTSKGSALFLSGDYADAARALDNAHALLGRSHGHIQRLDMSYFSSLTEAALAPAAASGEFERRRSKVADGAALLHRWAGNCYETFADKAALVSAELARIDGEHLSAMQLYDDAIALAKRHGFVQNEAIGNELASRYHRSRGSHTIADAYLAKAKVCYSAWGAVGKVRQLDQSHPARTEEMFGQPNGFERLDRSTILRVSQAISSEIDLDKLVDTLMRIALQDSGGERAVLVMTVEGGLWTQAEGRVVEGNIEIEGSRVPIVPSTLPESVVRFALRSGGTVVIQDASAFNPYAEDRYFHGATARSVVCVPIVKYQMAIGALYIENTRLSHVFTPERLDVLSLVSLQAGISLENARLFRDVGQIKGVSRRAESELRHSIDLIPVMVWSALASGRGATFNKQWHDYTGITAEAAQDGGWIYSFHPDDRERAMAKWSEIVEQEVSGELEARIVRSDGSSRYFLVRAAPLHEEDGAVIKWYGTNTDIDDLKRSEQLVLEERRILEMVGMGEALPTVLDALCTVIERSIERSAGAILLLGPDGQAVAHCRSPSLTDAFSAGVLAGGHVGSTGSWVPWATHEATIESHDLRNELPSQDGLAAHGTCWSTPVISFDRKVLGRLAVFLSEIRQMQPHELKFAEQIVRLTGIIVERKLAEERLTEMNEHLQISVGEKDALLKEVHHRVKNNLQLISSLLSLQADRVEDSDVAVLFAESRDRVRSMALVHENLYRAGNFAKIPMQAHVQNLCANLIQAYGPRSRAVELVTTVDDMDLDLDRAVSIGLIVNELVSNSLKHAFPAGRVGRVLVRLQRASGDLCILSVEDNGIGLPGDFDGDKAETLGLQLVRDLTDQLHGEMTVRRHEGTTFTISFPTLS